MANRPGRTHSSVIMVSDYVKLYSCRLLGVDGVDVVIGTSSFLREFSHGKDMAYITKTAIEVIEFVKSKGPFPYALNLTVHSEERRLSRH